MRTLGMGLMILGLAALSFAVLAGEIGTAQGGRTATFELIFYAGGAACAVGALMFTIRWLMARR